MRLLLWLYMWRCAFIVYVVNPIRVRFNKELLEITYP